MRPSKRGPLGSLGSPFFRGPEWTNETVQEEMPPSPKEISPR
jgi:hypothetical protein